MLFSLQDIMYQFLKKKMGIMGNVAATPLIQQLYRHVPLKGGHPAPRLSADGSDELSHCKFIETYKGEISYAHLRGDRDEKNPEFCIVDFNTDSIRFNAAFARMGQRRIS